MFDFIRSFWSPKKPVPTSAQSNRDLHVEVLNDTISRLKMINDASHRESQRLRAELRRSRDVRKDLLEVARNVHHSVNNDALRLQQKTLGSIIRILETDSVDTVLGQGNPWSSDSWSVTRQAYIEGKYPELVDKLKEESDTKGVDPKRKTSSELLQPILKI